MKSVLGFVWLLGCLLVIPQTDEEASRKELERHQGTWQAISYRTEETETPKPIVESITRTVKGKHVVWKRDGKSFAGTEMQLDPSKSPMTIDVIPDGGPFKGERVLGIYKLENQQLTLCMAPRGKPRPESWETPKGSGISLMVFKKTDPGEKKPEKP